MEVRCQREPWENGVQLMVFDKRADGLVSYAENMNMRTVANGEHFGEPTMRLKNNEAQMLMDELWRCGIRPSVDSGYAVILAATERHLKDMRVIALGLLAKNGSPAKG